MKVEFKVRFKDREIFERFVKSLKDKSDEFIGDFCQVDRYFGMPDYDSIYDQDEVLRARILSETDINYAEYSLTYKDMQSDGLSLEVEEKTILFEKKEDLENIVFILEHIGVPVILIIEKTRKRYAIRGVIVSLDEVKGLEHPYVELKMIVEKDDDVVKSRALMCSIVSEMIDDEDFIIENRSYLEIMLEGCKID